MTNEDTEKFMRYGSLAAYVAPGLVGLTVT